MEAAYNIESCKGNTGSQFCSDLIPICDRMLDHGGSIFQSVPGKKTYTSTPGGGVSVYFARDRLIGQSTFNTYQLACQFVR